MTKFSKTYEYNDIGQVVLIKDTNDEGELVVNMFFVPPGFGTCSIALGWEDTEKGYKLREKCFDDYLTKEKVKTLVLKTPFYCVPMTTSSDEGEQ